MIVLVCPKKLAGMHPNSPSLLQYITVERNVQFDPWDEFKARC